MLIEELRLIGIFMLTVAGCLIVLKNPTISARVSGRLEDTKATQAMHTNPTPRVGGAVALMAFSLGVAVSWETIGPDLSMALSSGFFVFLFGFKEDLKRNVSPRSRLFAAFASAGLALMLSSATVSSFGLQEIDWVFGISGVALAVTLIWSTGFCHALNLIDGLNGLAASYSIAAALGIHCIARETGQADVEFISLALIVALTGFLLFNWPFGRIFLGDAGAYTIGHVLAWLGIVLMHRTSDVSGFSILLILFWPVAETVFTIFRRLFRGHSPDRPDRLHFHHVVVRGLGLILRNRSAKNKLNSVSTLIILPLFSFPIMFGVLLWDKPGRGLVALLIFAFVFILTYVFGMWLFSQSSFSISRAVFPTSARKPEQEP